MPCAARRTWLLPRKVRRRKREREADRRWQQIPGHQQGANGRAGEAVTAVRFLLTPGSWGSGYQDSDHAHASGRVPRTWRSCPLSARPHAPAHRAQPALTEHPLCVRTLGEMRCGKLKTWPLLRKSDEKGKDTGVCRTWPCAMFCVNEMCIEHLLCASS